MASPGSLGIGKIYGIPIELNWIFILMILLFLIYIPVFGLVLVLLFVCVLIHELAHSVTAVRNKVNVSRIILLPFGGASVIDTTKINPRVEFNISIAGPLMSLFIGGVFGIIAVILPSGPVEQLANILFILNVFLGAFNIIPAFPMDGGRIFRSYIQKNHNFFDATMITAKVSKIMLVLIVVATLALVFFYSAYSLEQRLFDLLLTIVIVVFLYGGLKSEENSVIVRRDTAGVKIGEAASRHFVYVDPDATIEQLYGKVRDSGEHAVITRIGTGYGLIDLGKKVRGNVIERAGQLAVPIMTLDSRMSVSDGMSKLTAADVAIAAVTKNGKLAGVLTYQQLQLFVSLHIMKKKHTLNAM